MAIAGLVFLAFVLLALRQSVIVVLGTVVFLLYLFWGDGDPKAVIYDVWEGSTNEVLMSIPLYILAGTIMSHGSIASRLIELMRELTRPVPGGMALATVLSCAVFAAISGSSTVTLLAVGSIMYPALLAQGYSRSFSVGALCAAGTLGIIIPPSIPLILYGVMTQTSIADLFIAGLGPAAVLTTLMAAYAMSRNWSRREGMWQPGRLGKAFLRSVFALAVPGVILGGIYSGYFTPTESAAVAVLVALVVELLIHRELTMRQVYGIFVETAVLIGKLFPLLLFAVSLNKFLTFEQVPQQVVEFLTAHVESKIAFILATNALLLVVGTVVDIGSAVLILSPLLQPVAQGFGMDPVHFGIMMIVNLEIGYLTPPLGLNLIVAMGAFREDFWTICKAVIPFIGLMLIGLMIVAFVPALSLFLLE